MRAGLLLVAPGGPPSSRLLELAALGPDQRLHVGPGEAGGAELAVRPPRVPRSLKQRNGKLQFEQNILSNACMFAARQ